MVGDGDNSLTRRKCISYLLLAAVTLAIGTCFARPRVIGPACFHRIRSGMKLSEVESVIGLPHGDYYTRPPTLDWRAPYWGLREQCGEPTDHMWAHTTTVGNKKVSVRSWRGNNYYIHVAFDENDSVVAWSLYEILAPKELSFLERIRRWLLR